LRGSLDGAEVLKEGKKSAFVRNKSEDHNSIEAQLTS